MVPGIKKAIEKQDMYELEKICNKLWYGEGLTTNIKLKLNTYERSYLETVYKKFGEHFSSEEENKRIIENKEVKRGQEQAMNAVKKHLR